MKLITELLDCSIEWSYDDISSRPEVFMSNKMRDCFSMLKMLVPIVCGIGSFQGCLPRAAIPVVRH